MESTAFTVICHRRGGRWEITIPDVPNFSVIIDRLEDVPAAARTAIARAQEVGADDVPVLLDVRGA